MSDKELYEIYSILREDYSDIEISDAILDGVTEGVDGDILGDIDEYDLTDKELYVIATEYCKGVIL